MVKVLTVKSAKKQQQPDVFFLNLKADILYIAFIWDQALFFCTYWQVTLRWVQPRRASPSPQQPVGKVAEDSQPVVLSLSCCPVLMTVLSGQKEFEGKGGSAVGGAAEYVQVSVITIELLLRYQGL